MGYKKTEIYVVLNEQSLETLKNEKGDVLKFKSEKDANEYASYRLHLWTVVKCNFIDHLVYHKENI